MGATRRARTIKSSAERSKRSGKDFAVNSISIWHMPYAICHMKYGIWHMYFPDCLFHLGIDCGDIGLQAAHCVVLVFFGQLDVRGGLVNVLAVLLGLLGGGNQLAHEIAILFEVIPGHHRAVTGDDR